MRQPSSLQEAFLRFDQRMDHIRERLARWLNTKAVAIPLRGLRLIFLCYTVISVMVFSFILLDGDEIFNGPSPQEIRAHPAFIKRYGLNQLPAIPTNSDSLMKSSNFQK
jgi:hypothetical protein